MRIRHHRIRWSFIASITFWLFLNFGQRLESRYLCSHKSKIALMIILEAPTRILFISKGNPVPSHSMEFYSLTNFLAIFEFWKRLESWYLCSHKSKIPLKIILESPSSMLFITKGNPGPSHYMEF